MTDTPVSFDGIDLDRERKQRAAEREGRKQPLPVRIGGQVIATLPVELPLDVVAPLRTLDESLTLILRTAMQATSKESDAAAKWNATELIIDLLAANPTLPSDVLDVIRQVAVNLLTEDGLNAFLAIRPSGEDIAALTKGVFRFYGLTMGEALPSSDSSTDSGRTSSGTSSDTSASTPEGSGMPPVSPDSLVSAGS